METAIVVINGSCFSFYNFQHEIFFSVDAQRFFELIQYIHIIWSGPLVIALALYFLWDILGVAGNFYYISHYELWVSLELTPIDSEGQ